MSKPVAYSPWDLRQMAHQHALKGNFSKCADMLSEAFRRENAMFDDPARQELIRVRSEAACKANPPPKAKKYKGVKPS